MAKILIRIVVALVVMIITYNYFLGDAQEKKNSRRIVGQVAELGKSVVNLLKSETEKFDKGKYDNALGNLKSALSITKERAIDLGNGGHVCLQKCEHLEKEQQELQDKLASVDGQAGQSTADRDAAIQAIKNKILKLTSETENLAREIDG